MKPVVLAVVIYFLLPSMYAHADLVDDAVTHAMREQHIPAVSLAVVKNGEIVREQAFGYADIDAKRKATTTTLVQAASISKAVTAIGALRLVEQHKLALDVDVNTELMDWKIPDNNFTETRKVTLRDLLSHSAGTTVSGFTGYDVAAQLPTLNQILDGAKPANNPPIRVDTVPGEKWRYSGGGFAIVQKLVIDQSGMDFPLFMSAMVLDPFHMRNSSFEQPLPLAQSKLTATGYQQSGLAIDGRWHLYPELAAAGLWTTASDLARFIIGIQRAQGGTGVEVISQSMAHTLLVNHMNGDGLGVFVKGEGQALRFVHSGRNAGFDAYLRAYANTGDGLVILMNVNNDSDAAATIAKAIAQQYHWKFD